MEPFNLEQFKAGRKAITRDGRVAEFLAHCPSLAIGNELVYRVNQLVVLSRKTGRCESDLGPAYDLVSMAPAEPVDPYAELKQAWRDGKMLQVQLGGGWVDCDKHYLIPMMESTLTDGYFRIKPEADPYAELKAAHAAGETIQHNSFRVDEPHWSDMDNVPCWDDKPDFYRIKPAPPKLVPLEAEDIPAVCWLRIAHRWGGDIHVVQIHEEFVVAGHDRKISYGDLMDAWEYSTDLRTWKPCSKEANASRQP